jgi:hypothetical protein
MKLIHKLWVFEASWTRGQRVFFVLWTGMWIGVACCACLRIQEAEGNAKAWRTVALRSGHFQKVFNENTNGLNARYKPAHRAGTNQHQ